MAISNVSFSNSSLTPGGTTTVFYTLTNSGTAAAAGSTTGLFLSLPDGSSVEFQDSANSVGANSSIQESAVITLPGTIPAGSYFVGLLADRFGQILESNENNNTATGGPITVSASIDTVPGNASTTISLTPGQWLAGRINATGLDGLTGDRDYYKVSLQAGHLYRFDGDAGVSASDALDGIFIRLRDGSGNLLSVDRGTGGAAPTFTYTAAASGTYLLAVSADGSGDTWKTKTGDFQVKFTDVGAQSSYSFGTANKVVGESDGTVSFTLTRTNTVGTETVYVTTWQNWNGNGDYNGGDYAPKVGTNVTFLDGSATATQPITISITPDSTPEATQTFGLIATRTPSGALSDAIATTSFTITDDDSSAPTPGTQTAGQLFAKGGGELSGLALFSWAAYGGVDIVRSGLESDGWHLLNGSDLGGLANLNNGIFTNSNAAALVARSPDGKSIVIAFRGTDDGLPDVSNWPVPSVHYAKFDALLAAIDQFTPLVSNVYVTGHSLGAAMAQAFMDRHPNGNGKQYEAVTFATPGAIDLFDVSDNRTINFHLEDDPIQAARFIPGSNYHYVGHSAKISFDDGFDSPIDIHLQFTAQHSVSLYNSVISFLSSSSLGGVPEQLIRSAEDIVVPSQTGASLFSIGGGRYFDDGVGANTLTSSGADELLVGGTGDDTYVFSSSRHNGDDTIVEVSGNDTIVLGSGVTLRSIARHGSDVWLYYDAGATQPLSKITIENYDAHPIENIRIGNSASDTVANLLSSREHLADLNAASATATPGATFNASNVFGVGIDGNLSTKTVTFHAAWNPFAPNVNLAIASATAPADGIDGTTQAIDGFRDLIGTDLGDRLAGDDQDNILYSGGGDDLVQGGGGADTIIGGDGPGNDTYDGGTGIDTVRYSSTTLGIIVNLSAAQNQAVGSEIGTDQISNIENVIGGSGSDVITGNSVANILDGGPGADVLIGKGGDDTYYVDNVADTVIENNGDGTDTIYGTVDVTLPSNVETLYLVEGAPNAINAAGNGDLNFLYGNSLNNALSGYGGNDVLLGGGGHDILDGGSGNDTMWVPAATIPIMSIAKLTPSSRTSMMVWIQSSRP